MRRDYHEVCFIVSVADLISSAESHRFSETAPRHQVPNRPDWLPRFKLDPQLEA